MSCSVPPDSALAYHVQIESIGVSGESIDRSALATAVMEHANALINLASALMVTRALPEAKVGGS